MSKALDSTGWKLRRHSWLVVPAVACLLLGVMLADGELMSVVAPREGAVVGAGGVEVMVRFPQEAQVAAETLRVLLNGADISEAMTRGSNGAYGRLFGLLDGENVLRFEVFGRRWWLPGRLVEEAREVRFLVRLPQDLDRG